MKIYDKKAENQINIIGCNILKPITFKHFHANTV